MTLAEEFFFEKFQNETASSMFQLVVRLWRHHYLNRKPKELQVFCYCHVKVVSLFYINLGLTMTWDFFKNLNDFFQ